MMRFMESQDSICLPSFTSFSAVVSGICLLNGKKNNLEIYSFQFITSPSHITHCVVLQFKPELPYGHMFILTKLELRKSQTESIFGFRYIHNQWETMAIPIYTVLPYCVIDHGHPYIHSTTVLCDRSWPSLYTQYYRTVWYMFIVVNCRRVGWVSKCKRRVWKLCCIMIVCVYLSILYFYFKGIQQVKSDSTHSPNSFSEGLRYHMYMYVSLGRRRATRHTRCWRRSTRPKQLSAICLICSARTFFPCVC